MPATTGSNRASAASRQSAGRGHAVGGRLRRPPRGGSGGRSHAGPATCTVCCPRLHLFRTATGSEGTCFIRTMGFDVRRHITFNSGSSSARSWITGTRTAHHPHLPGLLRTAPMYSGAGPPLRPAGKRNRRLGNQTGPPALTKPHGGRLERHSPLLVHCGYYGMDPSPPLAPSRRSPQGTFHQPATLARTLKFKKLICMHSIRDSLTGVLAPCVV